MRRTKGIAKEVHGCYRKTSVLKPRKFDRHGSTIVYTHMHATAGNFFNFSYLAWEEEILSGRIFRNLREYLKQYPVHMKPEPVAMVGSKYEPKRRQRK